MQILRTVSQDTKTVGNGASVVLIAENLRRKYAGIYNASTNGLWLGLGQAAVIGTGIYVPPNGGWFEIDHDNLWQGEIQGISAAGAANVIGVAEFS